MTKFGRLRDEFKRLYLSSDVTWRELCFRLGICMKTVSDWRRKLGLPYRDVTKIRRRN